MLNQQPPVTRLPEEAGGWRLKTLPQGNIISTLPRLFTESPLGVLEAGVCPHAAAPAVTGAGLWLVMHQSPGPATGLSIIRTSVTLSCPAGTRNTRILIPHLPLRSVGRGTKEIILEHQ